MTGLPNAPSHFTATAVTARRFATHASARQCRCGPVARRNVAGQSLTLRRRHSHVRHSGPIHRTPNTARGFGILNELRHIGKSFRVTLRHCDRDAGLLKSAIDDVRAGEFRDERRQRIRARARRHPPDPRAASLPHRRSRSQRSGRYLSASGRRRGSSWCWRCPRRGCPAGRPQRASGYRRPLSPCRCFPRGNRPVRIPVASCAPHRPA